MVSAGLFVGQRRYAAAAGRATLLGECYWHRVISSIFVRIAREAAPCCGCFFRGPRPMTLWAFVRVACLMPILGEVVCHGLAARAGPAGATGSWQVVLAAGD